jgi:hypothetical protein
VSEYTESVRPSTQWGGFMEIAVFCLFYCSQVIVYQDLVGSLYEAYRSGNGHNGRTVRLNFNGSHYELFRPEDSFTTPRRDSKPCSPKKGNKTLVLVRVRKHHKSRKTS